LKNRGRSSYPKRTSRPTLGSSQPKTQKRWQVPETPSSHAVSHEHIKVIKDLRYALEVVECSHLCVEGELDKAISGIRWTLMAILPEVPGCLLSSSNYCLTAGAVASALDLFLFQMYAYSILCPAAISSLAIAWVTGVGPHFLSSTSSTNLTADNGLKIRTGSQRISNCRKIISVLCVRCSLLISSSSPPECEASSAKGVRFRTITFLNTFAGVKRGLLGYRVTPRKMYGSLSTSAAPYNPIKIIIF
jgi:hypothetical protein